MITTEEPFAVPLAPMQKGVRFVPVVEAVWIRLVLGEGLDCQRWLEGCAPGVVEQLLRTNRVPATLLPLTDTQRLWPVIRKVLVVGRAPAGHRGMWIGCVCVKHELHQPGTCRCHDEQSKG